MYNEHTASKAEGSQHRIAESPAEAVLQLARNINEFSVDVLDKASRKLSVYCIEKTSPSKNEQKEPMEDFPPYFNEMREHLNAVKQNLDLILQTVCKSGL